MVLTIGHIVYNLVTLIILLAVLSYVVGRPMKAVAGAVIYPVFRGFLWIGRGLVKAIRAWVRKRSAAQAAQKSELATETHLSETQLSTWATFVGADRTKLIRIEKGRVSCVLLFKGTTIERILRVHDPALVRELGFTRKGLTPLQGSSPQALTVDEATKRTRKDCKAILKATKAVPRESQDDSGAVAPPAPKPTEAPSQAAPVTAEPAKAPQPRPPTPQSYQGRLIKSGLETRTGVKEPYTSFCVDLEDSANPGATNRIWGADLARALQEVGASPGNMVKVLYMGKTPVPVRRKVAGNIVEKTEWKKLFKIERVHS